MEILVPIQITNGMLTSNVTITETLWTAGTYTLGQQRYKGTKLYEVIVASTTDDPEVGVIATVPTWKDIGSINKWKMFNETVQDQTVRASPIDVTIVVPSVITTVALINIECFNVTVTMTDTIDGLVYSQSQDMADIGVIDWWEYFFLSYEYLSDTIFSGLPAYTNAQTRVVLTQASGNAKCGELVLGVSRFIGTTQFGTSVGIIDYSKKATDDLGRFVITPKAFSKRVDFDLDLDTPVVSSVQRFLTSIRTSPCVFIGDPVTEAVIVYGFYKNFSIVLSNPASAGCTLQVEGLT